MPNLLDKIPVETTTIDGTEQLYGVSGGTTDIRFASGLFAMPTATQTLTNKRVTPRVGTVTSSATPTINTDNVDVFNITALTTAITSMTTNLSGTPTEGQELQINITGTAARAITWGGSFEDSAIALPTTTVTTAMLSVFLRWNSVTSKWRCMGATVAAASGQSAMTIQGKAANYTVVAADLGTIINCTANSFTVAFDTAATLASGFWCWVWNTSNTAGDLVTLNPSGSETIDSMTTLVLHRGEGCMVHCDGTNFNTASKKVMRLYAENIENTAARPVATGANSMALFWDGYNATSSQATASGALAIGGVASAAYGFALGTGTSVTANSGTALGRNSNNEGSLAAGIGAVSVGGSYASGVDSFAAAIASKASTSGAKGANSVALGQESLANAANSTAVGLYATSLIIGKYAGASGRFAASGDAQTGSMVLRRSTTDATPTVITSNGGAASTDNQVILPNDSTYAFSVLCVARRTDADSDNAAFEIKGAMLRHTNAASTALVAAVATTSLGFTAGAATWTCVATADTTNGGLTITVTGENAKTIRWVATVITSEVTG